MCLSVNETGDESGPMSTCRTRLQGPAKSATAGTRLAMTFRADIHAVRVTTADEHVPRHSCRPRGGLKRDESRSTWPIFRPDAHAVRVTGPLSPPAPLSPIRGERGAASCRAFRPASPPETPPPEFAPPPGRGRPLRCAPERQARDGGGGQMPQIVTSSLTKHTLRVHPRPILRAVGLDRLSPACDRHFNSRRRAVAIPDDFSI